MAGCLLVLAREKDVQFGQQSVSILITSDVPEGMRVCACWGLKVRVCVCVCVCAWWGLKVCVHCRGGGGLKVGDNPAPFAAGSVCARMLGGGLMMCVF